MKTTYPLPSAEPDNLMRHQTLKQIQRTLILIGFLAVLGIALIAARVVGIGLPDPNGFAPQAMVPAAFNRYVVIISGHAGSDSGAVCTDEQGNVTVTEADINARVAELAAARLRRAGADVDIFEEFDTRLSQLDADVVLSLHADSCIDSTGFKAAYHTHTTTPGEDQLLLACVQNAYAAETGLPLHPNTVTHDMKLYHAFNRIGVNTPAVILEMGFLGGDHELLTQRPQLAAKGVTDGVLCFLTDQEEALAHE